jgi:hypothetical protein
VTQHGSFPDRPRGRRARRDNDVPDDVPDWAGYDAVPRDERAKAPWDDQPWPASAPSSAPSSVPQEIPQSSLQPQPQARRSPVQPQPQPEPEPERPERSERPDSDWAGPTDPDPMEAFSERWRRRGSESREERRADRRKHRRHFVIGGGAAAVVIAVVVYIVISITGGSGNPAGVGLNSLITTFLPGEIQQVPNACDTVSSATLGQYLPGQTRVAVPPLNSGLNTQCTWTLDKAPLYRVLEVNIEAYTPSGLASGDGSATFAAIDAYAEDQQLKQDPRAHSGQPKATVNDLSSMPGGNDTVAFQATQVFNVNAATTDVATVVVRYRNVIITVVMNGLDHSGVGNYGPVAMSDLTTAAQTVAQEVAGQLVH